MTKKEMVLEHLKTVGNITSWDAINLFRATRLSAIIYDLKKEGEFIIPLDERGTNMTYSRYHYPAGKSYEEIEALYKKLCECISEYPDGHVEKEKMREYKAELEQKYPTLKGAAK